MQEAAPSRWAIHQRSSKEEIDAIVAALEQLFELYPLSKRSLATLGMSRHTGNWHAYVRSLERCRVTTLTMAAQGSTYQAFEYAKYHCGLPKDLVIALEAILL